MFAAGVAGSVLLAKALGSAQVQTALWSLRNTMPALLLLELARFAVELQSTRSLLKPRSVPLRPLLQAQCAAHVCSMLMPAGRAAAEGMRTAVLARHVGLQGAAGVGAAGQLITFLVNGGLAILAGLVTTLVGGALQLAFGMVLFGLVLLSLGLLLRAALASRTLVFKLQRLPLGRKALIDMLNSTRAGAAFGVAPVGWQTLSRLLQAVQLGILLHALSSQVAPALWLVALGLQLAGAAVGDFLPAHMGTTEGAFALGAAPLGISASSGLSLALALHAIQLIGVALALPAAIWLRLQRSSRAFSQPRSDEHAGHAPVKRWSKRVQVGNLWPQVAAASEEMDGEK